MKRYIQVLSLATAAVLVFAMVCAAAEKATSTAPKSIDFFDAKNRGLIEVKLVAKNSLNGQMHVKNLTDEPLVVSKPFAFGAVPVLAQGFFDDPGGGMGDMGGGRGGRGGGSSGMGGNTSTSGGGGNQSMGGGMGGGGGMSGMGGGGMGGMGGGMFNIPPKKSVRESVKTVCLEHGKKEPNLRVKYEVKPIGDVVEKPEVALLCAQIGTGRMNQAAGQAAVWHVNNDIPWQQLAAKTTIPAQGTATVFPYFSQQQLMLAQNSVGKIEQFVKTNNIEFVKEEKGTTSESGGDYEEAAIDETEDGDTTDNVE